MKADWITHPYTMLLIQKLQDDVAGFTELWSEGAFTSETIDATIQLNAQNIGKVQATKDILEWIKAEGADDGKAVEDNGISGTD